MQAAIAARIISDLSTLRRSINANQDSSLGGAHQLRGTVATDRYSNHVFCSSNAGHSQGKQTNLSEFEAASEVDADSASKNSGTSSTNSTSNTNGGSGEAIGYIRASSDEQVEEGNSIKRQRDEIKSIAEEQSVEIDEILVDEGESGFEFDRPKFQELLERATDPEIEHILIEEPQRFARNAPGALRAIHHLYNDCGVEIITNSGPVDLEDQGDLISLFFLLLSAEFDNRRRARRCLKGQHDSFKSKNWEAVYNQVPFGYRSDGDSWIEINPDEKAAAKLMFESFLSSDISRAYADVVDELESAYGDDPDVAIPGPNRVSNLIGRSVYRGRPSASGESIGDNGQETVVEDEENLRIVSDDVFEKAQKRRQKVRDHHGEGNESTIEMDDLIRKFGLFPVLEEGHAVELRCQDDECGAEFRKNGQKTIFGDLKVHNYQCPSCGKQRKFPKEYEYQRMELWDTS